MKSIIKNKKAVLFISLFFLLTGNFVFAHDPNDINSTGFWTPGQPIVPCGSEVDSNTTAYDERVPCDQCQFLHLIRHLIDFVMVAAAPILAVFFFIVAGLYMMLGGTNPGMLAQGKRIFKDTFIGLLIVMLSWLIVNTLLRSTLATNVSGNWWEFSCQEGIINLP